jgi:hypothetical protein
MKSLSKYQITWVEFTPEKGIVTKHDQKVFGAVVTFPNEKTYRKHFPSKEKAVEYLQNFDKKLDKKYSARLFTDAQFANASEKDGFAIKFTKKQMNEVFVI